MKTSWKADWNRVRETRTEEERGNYPEKWISPEKWRALNQRGRELGKLTPQDAAWLWALAGATWGAPTPAVQPKEKQQPEYKWKAFQEKQQTGIDHAQPNTERTIFTLIDKVTGEQTYWERRRATGKWYSASWPYSHANPRLDQMLEDAWKQLPIKNYPK